MKTRLILAAAVVISRVAIVLTHAQNVPLPNNLIHNGGMEETDPETPGLAAGWSIVYSSRGKHTVERDRDIKTEGAVSQRFENADGGMKYPRLFQTVKVKPNVTYRFSADVRAEAPVQVWLAKGKWGKDFGVRGIPADAKWHTADIIFNSGENDEITVIIILMAPNRQPGIFWVDNVALRPAGNPSETSEKAPAPTPKPTTTKPAETAPKPNNLARGLTYEFITPVSGRTRAPDGGRTVLTDGNWKSGYWSRPNSVVWQFRDGTEGIVMLDLGQRMAIDTIRMAAVRGGYCHPPDAKLLVGDTFDKLHAVGDIPASKTEKRAKGFGTEWYKSTNLHTAGRYVVLTLSQPASGLVALTEIEIVKGDFDPATAALPGSPTALEAYALRNSTKRFIPPADTSVVTPHVAWANNTKQKPKILFLSPAATIRDPIELAQRMNLDATFRYAESATMDFLATRNFLEQLNADWNALVLASVDWNIFRDEVKRAILDKVRAGMGLFIVKPLGSDAELKAVLDDLQPSSLRTFFSREKEIPFPYVAWVRGGCGMETGTLGGGV
ncbi:MAG: hypothetical protein K9N51_03525 [Candidatus Pacebacteria bacterium]|nr:hypothetical protein [Candidatus Paceibacterota bacterium]